MAPCCFSPRHAFCFGLPSSADGNLGKVPLIARSFWGEVGETAELLVEGSLQAFGSDGVGGVGGACGGSGGSLYVATVTSWLEAAAGTLSGG